MNEKLGPCPLCGGPADPGTEVVVCRNPECGMETVCNETWQALSTIAAQNRRLSKQNEDLFDTVLAVMCAAVGKSTITLRGSTEEQIQDLEKEVCSRGDKLSVIVSTIADQNRRRGEALEKLKKWADKIGYPDWVKLCEEALK